MPGCARSPQPSSWRPTVLGPGAQEQSHLGTLRGYSGGTHNKPLTEFKELLAPVFLELGVECQGSWLGQRCPQCLEQTESPPKNLEGGRQAARPAHSRQRQHEAPSQPGRFPGPGAGGAGSTRRLDQSREAWHCHLDTRSGTLKLKGRPRAWSSSL